MGKNKIILVASLVLLLFVLFSCAKSVEVRYPVIPPEAVTASYLIHKISYDHVQTLSAHASIRIFNDEDYSAYLTGIMNFQSPDSLGVSFFGPFGVTIMKVLIVEGAIEVYLPREDTVYTTYKRFPFILPDSKALNEYDAFVAVTEKNYTLSLYTRSGGESSLSARYYFDKRAINCEKIEKFNDDKLFLTIIIKHKDEQNIPTRFSIVAGDSRFEVTMKDLFVNAEIPESSFDHMQTSRVRPLRDFFRNFEKSP